MTKSEEFFRHSGFGIDSDFGFRISALFFGFFLIRQVLQILLDLRAIFFWIPVVARLSDRVAVALRQALVLAVAFLILTWQSSAEAAALDAIAIAGAAVGVVGAVAFLIALILSLALLLVL